MLMEDIINGKLVVAHNTQRSKQAQADLALYAQCPSDKKTSEEN